MVYNLNESLGYSRGAETNKTAPQTTNYQTNYPVKEVFFRQSNFNTSFSLIIDLIIISIINSTI